MTSSPTACLIVARLTSNSAASSSSASSLPPTGYTPSSIRCRRIPATWWYSGSACALSITGIPYGYLGACSGKNPALSPPWLTFWDILRQQPASAIWTWPRNIYPATEFSGVESEFAGDEHALHFRGAFADLKDLRVPVEPPHGELVHEPVTAEDLRRVPRVVHRRIGSGQLRDRRLLLERLAREHLRGGVPPGEPRVVRADLHVGDLELQRLEPPDRSAERGAVPDVGQRLVHAPLGESGGQGGDRDPALVQRAQELGVAPPALAEQVRRGHPAAVERQLVGVRTRPADLGVLGCHGEPRRARRHEDRGYLRLAVLAGAGHGGDPDHGGDRGAGVGDERLRPVDHPLPVLEPRPRLHRPGHVGAAARLGQPERTELLARAESRQPLPLLRLGAEPVDRHHAEPHPGLERDGHGGVHPGEFFEREPEREVVAAHAPVLLRDRQPEQPHPAHLRHDVVRELAAFVQVPDDRRHDVAGELLDALA